MYKYFLIPILIFAADQYSKYLAVQHLPTIGTMKVFPGLNFILTYNSGAAFGFLSQASGWQNLLFVVIAIVIVLAIIAMAFRLSQEPMVMVGLMFVLGGALGNMLDRIRLGYVVDFIDVYFKDWHWYTFNVADSAITVGAVLLFLDAAGVKIRTRWD